MRHEAIHAIARKEQAAGSSQQPSSSAFATVIVAPPSDFSGIVIDRSEKASPGTNLCLLFSAKSHGAARVEVGEIEDGIRILLRNIKQTCIRRVRGRLPV